ncbi:MAG: hypothetical protein HUU29_12995 [Planctomycetaceae bacterium]|nr:hypothetical protein [Planctomycetaceae bacterium]
MNRLIRILGVALFALASPLVAANDETDAAKAETKLDAKILDSFSCKDTPLTDALTTIAKEAGVSIIVDSKNVDAKDKTVTIELVSISAKNALAHVLNQAGLVRRFKNGVIVVTTKEAAEANPVLVTKTYDVRDITAVIRDFKGPKVELKGEDDKLKDPDDDDDDEKEVQTIDDLMDLIKETVEPKTWGNNGHAMAKFKGNLVVTTTTETQKKVAALLEQLRASK